MVLPNVNCSPGRENVMETTADKVKGIGFGPKSKSIFFCQKPTHAGIQTRDLPYVICLHSALPCHVCLG